MTQTPNPLQTLPPAAPSAAPSPDDPNTPHSPVYLVQIPEALVPQVARFLAKLNVPFDKIANMAEINLESVQSDVKYGHEVGELLEKVNEYLTETHTEPHVPGSHSKWTVQQTWDFLRLANTQFCWTNSMCVESGWWEDRTTWAQVTAEYPSLFPDPTTNPPTGPTPK